MKDAARIIAIALSLSLTVTVAVESAWAGVGQIKQSGVALQSPEQDAAVNADFGEAAENAAALPDSVVDRRAREVASQLRCVVCQGLSVEDSPSELAREMKQVVRDQIAAGRSDEEVKAYFVARYGEFVLLSPEPRGFNLVVYILPVAALLIGAGVVAAVIMRWRRAPIPTEGEAAASGGRPIHDSY